MAVMMKMSDFHFIRHTRMNFVGNLKAHNAVQSIQDASDTCHHYENLQNTDQECHQKRFLARVLKLELFMNKRPRVRKRQSRPRKYFVYMHTLKDNIYLLILCLATMGKVSQTCIFCKCLYSNLISSFQSLSIF